MTESEPRQPTAVRRMFDRIAGHYDLLNHLLSANLDRTWRRAAARELPDAPAGRLLDLCGGTGDMSLTLARNAGVDSVICCDFSHAMLRHAETKFRRKNSGAKCLLLEADGLSLPFGPDRFAAVTVAFGVRNFCDLDAGLREIHRVVAPGGRLIVLEFSRPTGAVLSRVYGLYLNRILPRLGDGISRASGPYGYLARTIASFPEPPLLAGCIREAGFSACNWSTRSGGIVAIHTAIKADG